MPWPPIFKPLHLRVNPVARRLAGRVGSLALITHTGRRTGRTYQTPVRAFRRGDLIAVGANFGADSDWVKNVLSAGGCTMVLRGERLRLTEARLVPLDDLPPVFPRWFETGLRHLVRTEDCLLLRVETDG